ncbi:bar domain containing protein [Grosmannia clavigera kw1407]|uniref:Bar domain containing protein n=1 Tax=Grosmannia clavigera (strain kw1407 / UAMH 11150) TaxID=655863 RepID=F0XJT1_GROCL|nr:bar domain containing protein [Grosmannia clavigera kw1407]EFX02275.1 bar domain containing protein [Grosmannia clavigera kw1407]
MNFTKKIDRAVQWAGEKMGGEAKTSMSEDFKMLETEMALRYDGMERLQRSMTAYVKWIGRRGEVFEDREKGVPASYLGRTMVGHGEDFEPDSEFGNCLVTLGRANERMAAIQEQFVADATVAWLESLDRSLAMMKEYQNSRKKLENRRLAYDASITKMQKAKRDDFRIEEELRTNRAKYEESNEDIMRRMQDIKDAEADSIRDLTSFMDCQLSYHERCADELRRIKRTWPGAATAANASNNGGYGGSNSLSVGGYGNRSRSNTARSYNSERYNPNSNNLPEEEPEPMPARMPIRSNNRVPSNGNLNGSNMATPEKPPRPSPAIRSNTFQGAGSNAAAATAAAAVSSLRGGLRPVGRTMTNSSNSSVHVDDGDDGSPEWGGDRSASPATSYSSLNRSTSNLSGNPAGRKPPPPPPIRSKKPAPPPPMKREVGY